MSSDRKATASCYRASRSTTIVLMYNNSRVAEVRRRVQAMCMSGEHSRRNFRSGGPVTTDPAVAEYPRVREFLACILDQGGLDEHDEQRVTTCIHVAVFTAHHGADCIHVTTTTEEGQLQQNYFII